MDGEARERFGAGETPTSLYAALWELEAFTYSVSHDLRAPLRAVDGFSQALEEDYGEELDEGARDYLRRIRRATRRMAEILDDLLRLSRLSRGRLSLSEVDLSELAREVEASLRDQFPHQPVHLEVEPDIRGYGDPGLLRVVLENLLGNAWKFTQGKEGARVEVVTGSHQGRTVVRVRDNGAGFDPEYGAKLFTPFQRLHREDEFSGHGIGLATAQRIVHRHAGRIWGEGAPGEGATFSFFLGDPDEVLHTSRSVQELWPGIQAFGGGGDGTGDGPGPPARSAEGPAAGGQG